MNEKKVNVQMLEPQPTNGIRTIDTTSSQPIAKPLVSRSFSKENMLSFAHYLRNGLTNLEYCQKEHEQHLKDWIQNYG